MTHHRHRLCLLFLVFLDTHLNLALALNHLHHRPLHHLNLLMNLLSLHHHHRHLRMLCLFQLLNLLNLFHLRRQ
jgi:hypothetical protein